VVGENLAMTSGVGKNRVDSIIFADGFAKSDHPHGVDIYSPAPRQSEPG